MPGTRPKERRAPQRLEGAFITSLVRQYLEGVSGAKGRPELEKLIRTQRGSGDFAHVGCLRDKRAPQSLYGASDPRGVQIPKKLEHA